MSGQLAQEVLKISPGITACAFGNRPWLSDTTLIACAQRCQLLETIQLWRCPNVTSTGALALVIGQGAKLREIQLIYCKQLDGAVVLVIAEHCPLLEKVACPSGKSDAAVARLVQGCPQLSYVNIGESRVADAGLTALAMHCVELKHMYLYKCPSITTQGLRVVAERCPYSSEVTVCRSLGWVKHSCIFRCATVPAA
jgi:hypothetical protein